MTEQLEWPAEPLASTLDSADRLRFKKVNGYDANKYRREVYGTAAALCLISDLAERDGKAERFVSHLGIHVLYGQLALDSELRVWDQSPDYVDYLTDLLAREGETHSFIYRYLCKLNAERWRIKNAEVSRSRNAESD